MKKFKVTYSNNGDKCTLNKSVKTLFADNKTEVRQTCQDLYAKTESFKIYGVKEL